MKKAMTFFKFWVRGEEYQKEKKLYQEKMRNKESEQYYMPRGEREIYEKL